MRQRLAVLAAALGLLAGAAPASAQFIPYFGKNKVKYDAFNWRVYKSPHFEVFYYPEFEQHLSRIVSYAESAYQKVSSDLKHELNFPVPLILYKTHSEFEQTNLTLGFVPEGALAFAEPVRDRMVMPIDEPPDRLQGLITHELTHIFEFDLIPRTLLSRGAPLWVDEGLSDYMRGLWDPLDLMMIRDAAVADQVPRMSRAEGYLGVNVRLVYNMGHACFEFIEARFGKEGIRQFLYTLRKGALGGGVEDIYQQAFRMRPEEFDDAFDKWLKERFKPFRDKQRPSDFGRDLSPDPERGPYTQVFAFAPSPSGELAAALTGNTADGELDLVLLSLRDRTVLRNLTSGYTGRYEGIALHFNARVLGRSLSFDPKGDQIAFFARTGKRRSLFLVSALSGEVLRQLPISLDEAESPCLLPDGRHALFSALKEGVSDIYSIDLETGETRNLTDDPFSDSDPQVSPDGKLVVYTRRISGYEKILVFPLLEPQRKTQLSFGTFDDVTPTFSPDGNLIYYTSNADDDIFNLRSLDLRTGVVRQFSDALGGDLAPALLPAGRGPERLAFIGYFKGEFRLHAADLGEPSKEVEQDLQVADAPVLDFQPEVEHRVVPENKRRKGTFEGLFLEGRPPLNVGVTSGGDFYGGTQVALTDVLGDHQMVASFISVSGYRSYDATYVNLSRRLHYGLSAFDYKQFFYSTPYGYSYGYALDRDLAFATQRTTGARFLAQYPLDKYRRLDLNAGVMRLDENLTDPAYEAALRLQYEQAGLPFYLNEGWLVPVGVSLVQETTRFREFGPLSGSTFALAAELSPDLGGNLSRQTFTADLRKYLRLGSSSAVLAGRFSGFYSRGENPRLFYFGGNMELRGFDYLSISGHQGFFANLELRLPVIDVMKTPLGLLGPVRGTLFGGVAGAHYRGQPYNFSDSGNGVSYINDPVFGEPVSGFRLVDGLASYGVGLQIFFLGYPMHFDWSKRTDFQTVSRDTRFDWWIGYDF